MISIPVALNTPYEIRIEAGGLDRLGQYLAERGKVGRVLVVSNPVILRHYGERVTRSLEAGGFKVATCTVAAGERYKTLRSVEKIYAAALAHRLERSSLVIALGGGVVGDMAGFAASTWLRGIRVAQVPTTLLAMVDAAIGGKTGVNHPLGKNLIGTFHQPTLVLIDPQVLATLPGRERRSAMAEVIKYGVIWDAELFARLEGVEDLEHLTPEMLIEVLERSCRAKAEVVARDEREGGLRAILNYGHTIGHAIETATRYRCYLHGEAVGLGMVAAGRVATELGLWSKQEAERQETLLGRARLPVCWGNKIPTKQLLELTELDKKVEAGKVRFILPEAIGRVRVSADVPPAVLHRVLDTLCLDAP